MAETGVRFPAWSSFLFLQAGDDGYGGVDLEPLSDLERGQQRPRESKDDEMVKGKESEGWASCYAWCNSAIQEVELVLRDGDGLEQHSNYFAQGGKLVTELDVDDYNIILDVRTTKPVEGRRSQSTLFRVSVLQNYIVLDQSSLSSSAHYQQRPFPGERV